MHIEICCYGALPNKNIQLAGATIESRILRGDRDLRERIEVTEAEEAIIGSLFARGAGPMNATRTMMM
jgi:hypothetical protein